ncbi:MAG: hypothetical protein ACRDJY_06535 [Thermoleophilaceae bacterium]
MRRLPISSALLAALATIALPAGEASALERLEPELGRKFVVALVSGDVFVKKPGAGRASRLTGRRTIRVGSTVNATKGSVKLVGSFTRKKRSKGVFSEGAFIATQAKRKRSVIELELTGGDIAGCQQDTAARAAQSSRLVRRLRGRAKGRFRTRGSHSAATVRGTKWLTEDFCDTTVITAQEGTVDVSLASAELQLEPGQEFVAYCDPALDTGLEPNYCIAGLNSPNEGLFAVGLGTRVHTGQYTLCIYAPSGDFECRDEPLPEPAPGDDFSISVLACAPAPDDGAGTYLVEWYYQGFLIGFLYIPVPNPMPQTYDLCPVSFEDLGSVSRQSLTSSEPAGRSLARPPGASAPSARQQLG